MGGYDKEDRSEKRAGTSEHDCPISEAAKHRSPLAPDQQEKSCHNRLAGSHVLPAVTYWTPDAVRVGSEVWHWRRDTGTERIDEQAQDLTERLELQGDS